MSVAAHAGGRARPEDAGGEPCGNDLAASKGSESWRSSVSACADSNLAGGTGGNSRKRVAPSRDGSFSGGSTSWVAPGWYPHNVELESKAETKTGDFLQEVSDSAAAAAAFAESVERNAAVRERKYSAVSPSFGDQVAQESETTFNLEEFDVFPSLEREREEGFPRQRQSVPGSRSTSVGERGIRGLQAPVQAHVFTALFRQVVERAPLIFTGWGSTSAVTSL